MLTGGTDVRAASCPGASAAGPRVVLPARVTRRCCESGRVAGRGVPGSDRGPHCV